MVLASSKRLLRGALADSGRDSGMPCVWKRLTSRMSKTSTE
jgi:hypothetical protein